MDKPWHPSRPQFAQLQNRVGHYSNLTESLWRLNESSWVYLAYNTYLMNHAFHYFYPSRMPNFCSPGPKMVKGTSFRFISLPKIRQSWEMQKADRFGPPPPWTSQVWPRDMTTDPYFPISQPTYRGKWKFLLLKRGNFPWPQINSCLDPLGGGLGTACPPTLSLWAAG